jgi:predicted S18 family serine protease
MSNIEKIKELLDEYAAMVNDTDDDGVCNACACCVEAKAKEIWEFVSDNVEDDLFEEGYLSGEADTKAKYAAAAAKDDQKWN